MADAVNSDENRTFDDLAKKKSIIFATVEGMTFGAGLSVIAASAADAIHNSWTSKRLVMPNASRVAQLLTSPDLKTGLPLIAPAIIGIEGVMGFLRARSHNKKVESFVQRLETEKTSTSIPIERN